MSRGVTLAVAGAVVLALVLAARLLLTDEALDAGSPFALAPDDRAAAEPVPAPPPAPAASPAARLDTADHPPAGETLAEAGSAAAEGPSTRVHGQLTLVGRDAPAAGLGLRFTWYPAEPDGGEGPPRQADVRADEAGRYDLELALSVPARLARAEVLDGGDVPDQRVTLGLALTPGDTVRHDLTLEAGVVLVGEVHDAGGRPVASATIHGWSSSIHRLRQDQLDSPQRSVVSDNAGRFRVAGLGPRWVLAAVAPDRTGGHRLYGRHPSGTVVEGLVLELTATRSLAVQVQAPDGAPLADARVRVRSLQSGAGAQLTDQPDVFRGGPRPREAHSGEDGRCRIDGLAERPVQVTVSHPAHPDWTGEHAPGDGELLVRMEGGVDLAGVVLGADGAPLPGARLRLRSLEVPSNDGETTSDDQGRFRFGGLARDEQGWLSVLALDHAVHVEQPLRILPGQPSLRIGLTPEWPLAGRVVDVAGAPVAGAAVAIEGDRVVDLGDVSMTPTPTWERAFGLDRAVTDDEGRFTFLRLYDGSFRLEASGPDGGPRAADRVRSGRDDVLLVLDPEAVVGVTFQGRAYDVTTGLPVTRFDVTPMLPDGGGGLGGVSEAFEDEQGRYRVLGLEPGPILLTASAPGYAPWSAGLTDYVEGEHRIDLALSPVRHVMLEVVGADGAPREARLSFRDAAGEGLMVSSGPGMRNSHLATDEAGRILADGLPADSVTVVVEGGPGGEAQEFVVDLRQQPSAPVRLVLDPLDGDP